MDKTVYDYIIDESTNWKTARISLTNSKDWNMSEHIERCFNVSNGWFHQGANDGLRPYDDIVTPIIDFAFRSEGFDVKDIIPYVNSSKDFYKSFIVKKYHPYWATENKLDTFIDEVVESSIIYDLVLVKDVNNSRPEVVSLQDIAFCDQSDILSDPICLKHQYSISDLLSFKGKWDDDKIDQCIALAKNSRMSSNDKEVKTPGKYCEIYELHGLLPESWLIDGGNPNTYVDQMHIISFYLDSNGDKQGLTLYRGKNDKITDVFKALKVDTVRSKGRACGRSIVERLFEPQVWTNYSGIRIKEMLDAASLILAQTSSNEITNQKLNSIKGLTVLKTEDGKPLNRVDTYTGANLNEFANHKDRLAVSARTLGSASETSLGKQPPAGTPFSLADLVVSEGEGIHDYRRGKIATFFADILYPELILKYLVDDINNSVEFLDELSLDEMNEVTKTIAINEAEDKGKEIIYKEGRPVTGEERDLMITAIMDREKAKGSKRFIQSIKDEIKEIPMRVMVNVAGKQRYMAKNADRLSKLISNILLNPQAFAMIPGLGSAYNQLLEESGMNPIDFSKIISDVGSSSGVKTSKVESPVMKSELEKEK